MRHPIQILQAFPRALRLNTCSFALFKTRDQQEIDSLFEEVAGVSDKENFYSIFERATAEPFGFLWINLCERDDSKVFRKGFTGEFLDAGEPGRYYQDGGGGANADQLGGGAAHRQA